MFYVGIGYLRVLMSLNLAAWTHIVFLGTPLCETLAHLHWKTGDYAQVRDVDLQCIFFIISYNLLVFSVCIWLPWEFWASKGDISRHTYRRGNEVRGDTIAVDEFVCLVRYITKHRDELEDMKRMGLANNTYHTLLPVVKKREVHRQTKMKLWNTNKLLAPELFFF